MTTPGPNATRSFTQRLTKHFGLGGPTEFVAVPSLLAILVALNILNLLHYRFDADEPQHLHVIWSWTQGLVQYRDVFDNHMPLFHILLSPIAALIGERANLLHWMRFVLLPAHFVAAWATYRIGTQLFSRRVGVWSVILAGFFANYHRAALEFRPDNLWAPLWLLCLTVLLSENFTTRKAWVGGLLLGLCFGLTMKSTLLLISLLVSVAVLLLVARREVTLTTKDLLRRALVFLAATTIVPLVIVIFFRMQGTWNDFFECVFRHQFFGPLFHRNQIVSIVFAFLFLPLIIYGARQVLRAALDVQVGLRRALVLLFVCFYFLILRSFWPLIARTDYLPWYPTVFVLLTGSLFLLKGIGQNIIGQRFPLVSFVAVLELAVLCGIQPFWKDDTRGERKMFSDILSLTNSDDYVFDCKGETVFRRRCFRPILETITMKQIRRGLIPNDAPRRCMDTRTCVVATGMLDRVSPETREFLDRNYVPVTKDLSVAGIRLQANGGGASQHVFKVVIPAEYKIVARDKNVSGTVDGAAYQGARFLDAGPHAFTSDSGGGELVLLWARAVDRNFTPFWGGSAPVR